ncbi:MAG: molecular chaperone SurA [Thioploca sp.]|nr:molecular chaperone SurA [Thioploca sp.]
MTKLQNSLISWLLLSICSVQAHSDRQVLDYIVAVVNDEVIVKTDLQQELQEAEKNLQQQKIAIPSRQELEKQVLERMIMTTLQLQLAERSGIAVEDNRLNEKLRNLAEQNQMDLSSFRRQLEHEGQNYEKVREKIRSSLILERLQQHQVVSRVNVTDREIDNFLANQTQQGTAHQEYHLWHILIATPEAPSPEKIEAKRQQANTVLAKLKQGADFQATAVAISDSRQALEGGDLGWLKAGEMPSLFNDIVEQMNIGEIQGPLKDASGFHIIKLVGNRGSKQNIVTQTQVRHILIKTSEFVSEFEAKNRLETLKARIEQGDDFTELARANSQDGNSAVQGGLIGWVNPGDLVPEFENVMNNLAPNQLSEPFKSRYGWHIVQVLARRQYDNTEQALRTKAAHQIHQRKVEEELQAWLRQLRDEAYVEYRLENAEEGLS